MEMYEVCAKCGHVGRNYYVDKIFAVKAESGKEAAAIVRNLPRVKHDHKDAIRYVEVIDESRFEEIRKTNSEDPYFSCKNIQEQRAAGDIEKVEEERIIARARRNRECSGLYYGKQMIRNPKKYVKMYAI